jgi:hypothetical protein
MKRIINTFYAVRGTTISKGRNKVEGETASVTEPGRPGLAWPGLELGISRS